MIDVRARLRLLIVEANIGQLLRARFHHHFAAVILVKTVGFDLIVAKRVFTLRVKFRTQLSLRNGGER